MKQKIRGGKPKRNNNNSDNQVINDQVENPRCFSQVKANNIPQIKADKGKNKIENSRVGDAHFAINPVKEIDNKSVNSKNNNPNNEKCNQVTPVFCNRVKHTFVLFLVILSFYKVVIKN